MPCMTVSAVGEAVDVDGAADSPILGLGFQKKSLKTL